MAALCASVLLCATAFADHYYVDPAKSNLNDGRSPANAVQTITKALEKANGGDTVHLQGKYYKEHVVFPKSGANGNRIVLDGENATIEGPDSLGVWAGVIEMHGKSFITVRRCFVGKSNWFGIMANEWSNNVIFELNYTYDTYASGIYVNSAWAVDILTNTVDNACYGNVPDTPGNDIPEVQECLSVGKTSGFKIAYNEVRNSWVGFSGGEGIDAKEGCSNGVINNNTVHHLKRLGIYVDSYNTTQTNITVHDNTIYTCGDGIAIAAEAGGELRDVIVRNNTISWCEDNGIVVPPWGSNEGDRRNITIENNTLEYNRIGIGIQSRKVNDIYIRGNTIRNNTVAPIKIWDTTYSIGNYGIWFNMLGEPGVNTL